MQNAVAMAARTLAAGLLPSFSNDCRVKSGKTALRSALTKSVAAKALAASVEL